MISKDFFFFSHSNNVFLEQHRKKFPSDLPTYKIKLQNRFEKKYWYFFSKFISFLKSINIMPVLGEEIFPWKFNLEYGSTFTKLFMHVSSRNMFPTIRNLQIRVHVYRPRHCCGDWLTFVYFVTMIADHDLVTKR